METAKPKIMVIDDDVLFIETLTHRLQKLGYPISYAQSGEAAIRMLNDEPCPGMIFLDLNMPGVDGFEVLKRIQSNPKTASIPVVMLSAYSQDKDSDLIKRLGAHRFIDKVDATPDKIVECVQNVMGSNI